MIVPTSSQRCTTTGKEPTVTNGNKRNSDQTQGQNSLGRERFSTGKGAQGDGRIGIPEDSQKLAGSDRPLKLALLQAGSWDYMVSINSFQLKIIM